MWGSSCGHNISGVIVPGVGVCAVILSMSNPLLGYVSQAYIQSTSQQCAFRHSIVQICGSNAHFHPTSADVCIVAAF